MSRAGSTRVTLHSPTTDERGRDTAVTLADRVFGGSSISPRARYVASWSSVTVFAAVAVGIWFVPDDVVEDPAGRWGICLICAVMAAFAWWGNRWVHAEMRRRPGAGEPDPEVADPG